jgi:hypothetical protein
MPATKTRTFRLSEHELARIKRVADNLDASEREVVSLGVLLLAERLGLQRQAGVELAERLAREHGDQAPVVAALRHDERAGYFAEVTVAGEPVDELEPWLTMAIAEIAGRHRLDAVTVHVRDESGVSYLLGTLEAPAEGDQLTVRVRDLPDLVVQRSERPDRKWRENLEMDLKLRALLHRDDEQEE